ncbi:MAG: hypothetical protein COT85_00865 [Chlamydiae bacterium CG10_big_fil_rev_8_21_14_0_10_42_34]|nr:MAG: hypothetical protein COT85_00865 [Chlamydiae bacterium CG10_big_fil_rev_8_21_14_0_10_42_34]
MKDVLLAMSFFCLTFGLFSNEIQVVVASKAAVKINAVKHAFQKRFPLDQIFVAGYSSDSAIPEQPVGREIALQGVLNRAKSLPLELVQMADFVVSIENFIELTEDGWCDVGLIGVNGVYVFTKPTPIPSCFVEMAQEQSLLQGECPDGLMVTVGSVIQALRGSAVDAQDWHKEVEFGGISRQDLLEEALFSALSDKK